MVDGARWRMTTTARQWPAKLQWFEPRFINRALFAGAARTDRSDARFQLLEALYEARWKLTYGFEPSQAWTDFARLLLERGDVQRATEVAARIDSPRELLAMRVDKRYDAIVHAVPARFDIDQAMARQVATLEKLSRDTVGVKNALEYMREHQADAWSTFQTALVDANELEAAASLLIRRLKDPALRGDALSEMQDYRDGALSPVARTLAQRWRQVKARPDVQAALAEVGRIEKVSLAPPLS